MQLLHRHFHLSTVKIHLHQLHLHLRHLKLLKNHHYRHHYHLQNPVLMFQHPLYLPSLYLNHHLNLH